MQSSYTSDDDILSFISANLNDEKALVDYLSALDRELPHSIVSLLGPNGGNILHTMILAHHAPTLSTFKLFFSKLNVETIQVLMSMRDRTGISPFAEFYCFKAVVKNYSEEDKEFLFNKFMSHISYETLNGLLAMDVDGKNIFGCALKCGILSLKQLKLILCRADRKVVYNALTSKSNSSPSFSPLISVLLFGNILVARAVLDYIDSITLVTAIQVECASVKIIKKSESDVEFDMMQGEVFYPDAAPVFRRYGFLSVLLAYIANKGIYKREYLDEYKGYHNAFAKKMFLAGHVLRLCNNNLYMLDVGNLARYFYLCSEKNISGLQKKLEPLTSLRHRVYDFKKRIDRAAHIIKNDMQCAQVACQYLIVLGPAVSLIMDYLMKNGEDSDVVSKITFELQRENNRDTISYLKSICQFLNSIFSHDESRHYKKISHILKCILEYASDEQVPTHFEFQRLPIAAMAFKEYRESEKSLLDICTPKNESIFLSIKSLVFRENESECLENQMHIMKQNVQGWGSRNFFFQAIVEQLKRQGLSYLGHNSDILCARVIEYRVRQFSDKSQNCIFKEIGEDEIVPLLSRSLNITLVIMHDEHVTLSIIKQYNPIAIVYLVHDHIKGHYSSVMPTSMSQVCLNEKPIDTIHQNRSPLRFSVPPPTESQISGMLSIIQGFALVKEVLSTIQALTILIKQGCIDDKNKQIEAKMTSISLLAKHMSIESDDKQTIEQEIRAFENKFIDCKDPRVLEVVSSLTTRLGQIFAVDGLCEIPPTAITRYRKIK